MGVNGWTHVAASYDGTTLRLYRNDVLVSSKALNGGLMNTSNPLKIGGNSVWSEWFKGQIDEVRIWNGARAVAEIGTDMKTPIS
jgi:hypothetical protein